jgi:hypothetical protein
LIKRVVEPGAFGSPIPWVSPSDEVDNNSAAPSAFASGIAMIISPTSPGTGVIHEARSLATSKSTSP